MPRTAIVGASGNVFKGRVRRFFTLGRGAWTNIHYGESAGVVSFFRGEPLRELQKRACYKGRLSFPRKREAIFKKIQTDRVFFSATRQVFRACCRNKERKDGFPLSRE